MGNRAVIVSHDTTKENVDKKIGIYVHWYGSQEDVVNALTEARDKGVRGVDEDDLYFWARFCQVFANQIGGYDTGIGIGRVCDLDCHNYDNGVYYIDNNFDIVKHTDGKELI